MNHRRFIAFAALGAAACLALSSCGSASPGAPSSGSAPNAALGAVDPGLPTGDVLAQGTVLDDGSGAELCLGAIQESYPPQCSGIPLEGWSWEGLDGSETEGSVTWGAYAVQGTYDGDAFELTQPPVMLALFDPAMPVDPTGGKPGKGTESELVGIQETLHDRLGAALLSSSVVDGWLWVDVLWDDGTWQDAADGEFGAGKIVIRSAMTEVD
jgi:hypothetical protein